MTLNTPTPTPKILVVDDHEAVLNGTVGALKEARPEAAIRTAMTAQETQEQLALALPDLLVMDLSIPTAAGQPSQTEIGLELLTTLLKSYPELNVVVQSTHVKSLVLLKPTIDTHQGGFTVVDKNMPLKELLLKVDWALNGLIYTPPEIRPRLEVKSDWLRVLRLAYKEGLQDKAIAEKMQVSERSIRYYWSKIQDALDVYPEAGKNIRIQTEIQAREKGLID
ncbi:MAG: response regulator transcription factor [Cyanobacteria bacterium J06626_18]